MSIHYNIYSTLRLSIVGLVLGLGAFDLTPDYLKVVVSAFCSVVIGLVMQLALTWDKGNLTLKKAVVQSIFSMGIGYMTFFWLEDLHVVGMKRHIVLAIFSFIAGHLVPAMDSIGRKESKNIVQLAFDRLIGVINVLTAKKKDDEDKSPKH